ncbi:MAG: co-chaperone GroES family protein [Hymenobacteraceae bacterium]|nr:co-chaperone GroES family protein [Hymenobacteraceae bacterium]MDX5397434.1 co-chaperone GroES family protein [Hymenobacteraceae bacterium]MDX5442252.1 co-chaperone GroES family protein [Hymenobacteraceae bacterium]MDX5513512.1 co-chaperone GroES family protein [Hymenobacteraceae bacterium]
MRVLENNKLQKIIMVGDRVLIKPKSPKEQTKSGLFLPPGVQEKEKAQEGYIMKVGPGYPIPADFGYDEEEAWMKGEEEEEVRYIPLQAKEGDLAIYLQRDAVEINYQGERYYIVPQSAVLMLVREEDLF